MDYRILDMSVYSWDVVKLRQRLVETWTAFKQSIVMNETIEQWRDKLRSCVPAEVDHFEHLLQEVTSLTAALWQLYSILFSN